jgi:hypothetical protein
MPLVRAVSSKLQTSPDAIANSRSIGIQPISTIVLPHRKPKRARARLPAPLQRPSICRVAFTRNCGRDHCRPPCNRLLPAASLSVYRLLASELTSTRIAGATIAGRFSHRLITRRKPFHCRPPNHCDPNENLPKLNDPAKSNKHTCPHCCTAAARPC